MLRVLDAILETLFKLNQIKTKVNVLAYEANKLIIIKKNQYRFEINLDQNDIRLQFICCHWY